MVEQGLTQAFRYIYSFFCNPVIDLVGIVGGIIAVIIVKLIQKKRVFFHAQTVVKYVSLFFGVCVFIISVFCLASYPALIGEWINIDYLSPDAEESVTTITTTLFTTLFTVSLTLLGIDVTAYIFLDGALQNREKFEQIIIQEMQRGTKGGLIVLSGWTGTCLMLSLMADNIVLQLGDLTWLGYCVALASAVNIIFLLIFLYQIINYEKNLDSFAKSIVKDCIESLPAADKNVSTTNAVKAIGDIEVIVEQLVRNHEAEFHNKVKSELVNQVADILKKKDQNSKASVENIACRYQSLIRIRNCLLFLGLKIPEDRTEVVADVIHKLITYLGTQAMYAEQFKAINFSDICFKKANFERTAFSDAALINVDLSNARLREADFRQCLLQKVDLSGADCEYTVFRGAKFLELKTSSETVFTGAVFREADLSTVKLVGVQGKKISFNNTACQQTNFIGCVFADINFDHSVFPEAQFTTAKIKNCSFLECNFEKALLVSAQFTGSCRMDYANLTEVTAASSLWGEKNGCGVYMKKARLARGNFTKAKFHNCVLCGVYANDTSFIEAAFEHCKFNDAIMIKADLTDSKIICCSFRNANLVSTLLVYSRPKQESYIEETHFNGANFSDAEIRSCTFKNCHFDNAIFHGTLIRNVTFDHCSFDRAQFSDALIIDAKWTGCSGCQVSMKRIDFGTFQDSIRMRRVFCIWK